MRNGPDSHSNGKICTPGSVSEPSETFLDIAAEKTEETAHDSIVVHFKGNVELVTVKFAEANFTVSLTHLGVNLSLLRLEPTVHHDDWHASWLWSLRTNCFDSCPDRALGCVCQECKIQAFSLGLRYTWYGLTGSGNASEAG